MTVLRTATGKTYPCDFMGVATGYNVLYVKLDIDLFEALTIFQNPEETNVLEWIGEDGEVIRTENSFINFGGIYIMEGDCPIRIRLLKG